MNKHGRNIIVVALCLIAVSIVIYIIEQAFGVQIINRQGWSALSSLWTAFLFHPL